MVKRTFIAQSITISNKLKSQIEEFKRDFKGLNVKWSEIENMHLTLSFLGDTNPEQIEIINQKLRGIILPYKPFVIRLNGLGVFKSLRNPQVIWIGIEADKTLELLYQDIQKMVGDLGFPIEERSFKPHLTLGRVKGGTASNNMRDMFQKYSSEISETLIADTIVYYESILKPAGPIYKPISTYILEK